MEGIIVHAEHVYRETSVEVSVFSLVLFVVILTGIAWSTIRSFKNKEAVRWVAAVVLAFVTIFFAALSVTVINSMLTIHTDKIVTIDDSVRFNEFYDHYKIISQDGNLYTVRELPIEETEAGDE